MLFPLSHQSDITIYETIGATAWHAETEELALPFGTEEETALPLKPVSSGPVVAVAGLPISESSFHFLG